MASRKLPISTATCLTGLLTAVSGITGAQAASMAGLPSLIATTHLAQSEFDDEGSDEEMADESEATDDGESFEESEEDAGEGDEATSDEAESSEAEETVDEEEPIDEEASDTEDAGDDSASDETVEAAEPESEGVAAEDVEAPAETEQAPAPPAAPPPPPLPAEAPEPIAPDANPSSSPAPLRGSREEREDTTLYRAVVNHEEQYSIWPVDKELPLGWNEAGKTGSREEVLKYIEDVWTDMRPQSLRKKMEQMQSEGGNP